MRNTVNLFLEEAPFWQVFIALFFLISTLFFPILFLFNELTLAGIDLILNLKLSVSIGALIGAMGTVLTSIARKSSMFWDFAKRLECKVDDANCKEVLDELYNKELQELRCLSFGTPHYEEIRKIHTIIKTKYKYVK